MSPKCVVDAALPPSRISREGSAGCPIISLNALARLERGEVDPRMSTLMAVHKALTEAGIEFLAADVKGEGVRLARP